MEPANAIAATPFFAGILKAGEIDRLAGGALPRQWQDGETIVVEGEAGSSMFVIVEGVVAIAVKAQDEPVARLGAGDILGEMSLLTGAPRSATATAEGPVSAVEIPKDALQPILAAEPSLYDRFGTMMEQRQEELDGVYGAGRWNVFGLNGRQLSTAMLSFFGPI